MVRKILFLFMACLMVVSGTAMAQETAVPEPFDWEKGTITVVGYGMAPPTAINFTHGQMLAKRAAVVDGYRNLAELVKGVRIDSNSNVDNMMVNSDTVKASVDACIKGAKVVAEQALPEGGWAVTMTMPIFGGTKPLAAAVLPRPAVKEPFPTPHVRVNTTVTVQAVTPYPTPNASAFEPRSLATESALFPALQSISVPDFSATSPYSPTYSDSYNAPATVYAANPAANPAAVPPANDIPQAKGGYTGLVIDCTGLGLEPCMSPVVRNDQGEAIYGVSNLDYDLVVAKGMASYLKSFDAIVNSRAGSNPLVLKCLSLERNNIDPVISLDDANRTLVENEQSHFLADLKVVFVR